MRPNIGPAAAGPAGPVATALRCQWVVGTEIHQQETQKHNRGSAGSHSQIEKTHTKPRALITITVEEIQVAGNAGVELLLKLPEVLDRRKINAVVDKISGGSDTHEEG